MRPRIVCPVCGRMVALSPNGRYWAHGKIGGSIGLASIWRECLASRRKPDWVKQFGMPDLRGAG